MPCNTSRLPLQVHSGFDTDVHGAIARFTGIKAKGSNGALTSNGLGGFKQVQTDPTGSSGALCTDLGGGEGAYRGPTAARWIRCACAPRAPPSGQAPLRRPLGFQLVVLIMVQILQIL